MAIHVGHRTSVGNLCDFLLCIVDNLHYSEQGFWHSIYFIVEHNCYEKRLSSKLDLLHGVFTCEKVGNPKALSLTKMSTFFYIL